MTFRTRISGMIALLVVAAGLLAVTAGPAAGVACPTVDSGTGAVTPPPTAGVDWSACPLTGANLVGATLDLANLSKATLTSASLAGASLTSANLSDAIFTTANLTGANLNGALLARADLSTATLDAVRSGGLVGTPKFLPPNWSVLSGYLIGPTADLTGAALTGAHLKLADLATANLTDAVLTNANLNSTNLASATLAGVVSAGITGTPAALPKGYLVLNGYLIGPAVNLTGAQLPSVSLVGAKLGGAKLASANLTGADLGTADLTGADLTGANLTSANLKGATLTGATLTGVTWSNTTCPDGTNSDKHVAGCLTPLDTTPPKAHPVITAGTTGSNGWYTSNVTVTWNWTDDGTIVAAMCATSSTTSGNGNPVTLNATCTDLAGNLGHASDQVKVDTTAPVVSVTGVRSGGRYVLGKVPVAGCGTTDAVSGVATPAAVQVTTTGSNGVGPFTATCAGAVSIAGNPQAAPVRASYTVGYGFGGFTAPLPNSTLRRSAHTIAVSFRLTDAAGTPIASTLAAALGAAHQVQVTLRGPGITSATAGCAWNSVAGVFQCDITTPAGIRTGKTSRYSISAYANLGAGFALAPAVRKAVNPETIYFR